MAILDFDKALEIEPEIQLFMVKEVKQKGYYKTKKEELMIGKSRHYIG